ncbi:MAG TPA: flagellar hook capping FlgD N-terminal domain-containing protein [Caulobacteraceae bacterium]|nr:flagellar hook capping FlgD N-terminal domain-containing protein [Caulobacteraceae bacterium]
MATTATSSTSLSLDPSAFLNLFVTQLKYQDPTAPMDPSQMTSVLAQLSTVQDLSNLQTSFQQSLADGMIGDQVTYTQNNQSQTGQVQASQVQNGVVGVVIGGQFVSLSAITEIAPTSTNSAPGTTTGAQGS